MPPASFLIKPASSSCNLRCNYCFYHSVAENRNVNSHGIMNNETAEVLVKKALEYADASCTFAFQGGEPTIAGLDYFRNFVALVSKYNTKKIHVNYVLQTNGLLIDDQWADFLARNKFLVGLSIDGPKDNHDRYRIDANGKGSFSKAINASNLFNKFNVEYNVLCVINSYVANHADKVYNFFKRNGFKHLQFIPCLDPLKEEPGMHDFSLTPEKYTLFLKNIFDQWYDDIMRGEIISIRYFENLISMILGNPPEACSMVGFCLSYFVMEANGGVYPCDFYVTDEWYLGSILDNDFTSLKDCQKSREFTEVSKHIDSACLNCEWNQLCRGGCRRNREPFKDQHPTLNYYCRTYKEFFDYAGDRFFKLARMLSHDCSSKCRC